MTARLSAAILEGAHYVEHAAIMQASKGHPLIEEGAITVATPDTELPVAAEQTEIPDEELQEPGALQAEEGE